MQYPINEIISVGLQFIPQDSHLSKDIRKVVCDEDKNVSNGC